METPQSSEFSFPPLPLMEGGREVKRSINYTPRLNPYVLRFTPASQEDPTSQLYGFDEIVTEFLQPNDIDIFVLAAEQASKLHYHAYIESPLQHKEMKEKVKAFIYSYYHTRTRGFGNAQYNIQISEKPLNAIIYNLKQIGRQEFSGFTQEFINECRTMAFEKKETDFEREIMTLTEKFLKDETITPYTFGADIAILHSKFDKRVHWRDIQGFVNSKLIKRNPSMAYTLASSNLIF